jgi:hypothetical protein
MEAQIGEDNHLATAMDPWSRGELLTHHSGGRHGDEEGLRWWFPSPVGCREELLDPPDLRSMMAAAYSTFRGWRLGPLGFSQWSEFIGGKGDVRGRPRGPHQGLARPGWGCAILWCGRLLAGLRLPFGLRLRVIKIGTLAFVSSNSENIFCITFMKYKNNRKQELALWHLVNRLVPENA